MVRRARSHAMQRSSCHGTIQAPKQSRERGEIWGEIAQNLNGLSVPKFTVRTRSVRDRLTLLLRKYKEKVRNEEQGSGMKCDEETELEMALSEIIEKEQAADLERKENTNTLTKRMKTTRRQLKKVGWRPWSAWAKQKRGMLIHVMKLSNQKAEEVPLKLCKF